MVLSKFAASIDHGFASGKSWGAQGSSKLLGQPSMDFCFPARSSGGKFSIHRARDLSAFLSHESPGPMSLLNQSHQKLWQKTGYASFLHHADGDQGAHEAKEAHEDHSTGDHSAEGEKTQHKPCKDRSEAECDEHDSSVAQECGWAHTVTTGGGLSAEHGTCEDSPIHLWPEGMDLVTQLSEVFVLEGIIAFTAWYLRNNSVEICKMIGLPKPDYDTRLRIWWYPSSALYVLFGLYYYQKTQGWNTIDTLYFLAQVFSTVGYGDVFPGSNVSKVFTICHVCLGIAIVGGACGEEMDIIFASRIDRANYTVAMAADFKDLLPSIWAAALQIRLECQDDAQLQQFMRQLKGTVKYMKLNQTDTSALAWLEEGSVRRLVHREVTGTGHMIPWPQDTTKKVGKIFVDWASPAARLRSILACLELVITQEAVPKLSSQEMLEVFAEDAMADTFFWEPLRNSAAQVGLLVAGGTLFFGYAEDYFADHEIRSGFDGTYMSIIGATSVGFGDFAAHTTYEKVFCLWFFSQGVIITSSFIMYLGEMFSYKGSSTAAIVEKFTSTQARDMHRLKEGEEE